METIELIKNAFKLDLGGKSPIEIDDVGRFDLAALFRIAGFRVGAEVGVEQGEYSKALCKLNPDLHLFCIDAWTAHKEYKDHITQQKFDDFLSIAKKKLKGFNVTFIKKFSMDAVKDFEDGSLDFVYIDANHGYKYVLQDITEWSKKVRKGGIVSGHDYIKRTSPRTHQVVRAVDEYVKDNDIKTWFLFGSKNKQEGKVRDAARSWAWVKE